MNHQKADLTPWRDFCIIDDEDNWYDIFFLFEKEKSAIIANQWIRDVLRGN